MDDKILINTEAMWWVWWETIIPVSLLLCMFENVHNKIKFKITLYCRYEFTTFCPFFSLEPLSGKSPKMLIWGYKGRTAGQPGSTDEWQEGTRGSTESVSRQMSWSERNSKLKLIVEPRQRARPRSNKKFECNWLKHEMMIS